jgi:putative ABC transport system substrate-binding protein
VKRRAALALAVAAGIAAGMTVRAQSPVRVPRIGVLRWGQPGDEGQRGLTQALAAIGYRDGSTIRIEWRFAQTRDLAALHAAELVGQAPDLLVASATPAGRALRDATHTIPIVLATSADPVGAGLVQSLARPGGNITGASNNLTAIVPKQIELLREMQPGLQRVAFLGSSEDVATPRFIEQFRAGTEMLGMARQEVQVARAEEFSGALDAVVRARSQAVVVQPLFTLGNPRPLAEMLVQRRLPSVSGLPSFVAGGGLMAYGANRADSWRRSATYIDRVLKGARPADLPIEDPTTFELGINQKTARALDITVPRSLLARADEVVE